MQRIDVEDIVRGHVHFRRNSAVGAARCIVNIREVASRRKRVRGAIYVPRPKRHRKLGKELAVNADADTGHIPIGAAIQRAALPLVKANRQTGLRAFLRQRAGCRLAVGAREQEARIVAGVRSEHHRVVRAAVVDAETVRCGMRAAANPHVAFKAKGLDDQSVFQVVKHQGRALAVVGIGDAKVTAGDTAARAPQNDRYPVISGAKPFVEGVAWVCVEVQDVRCGSRRVRNEEQPKGEGFEVDVAHK